MKLVEILARELKEWPSDAYYIGQDMDGRLHIDNASEDFIRHTFQYFSMCDDPVGEYVTRAQWEAERARILAESSKFTEEDKARIADLTAIACGKRSKEDQDLWDDIAKAHFKKVCTEEYSRFQFFAEIAFDAADEFMAERAKRMKG